MKKKILLDTNILIYYINRAGEFNKRATAILQNAEYELYISSKNISEFFAVMTKLNVSWDNITPEKTSLLKQRVENQFI